MRPYGAVPSPDQRSSGRSPSQTNSAGPGPSGASQVRVGVHRPSIPLHLQCRRPGVWHPIETLRTQLFGRMVLTGVHGTPFPHNVGPIRDVLPSIGHTRQFRQITPSLGPSRSEAGLRSRRPRKSFGPGRTEIPEEAFNLFDAKGSKGPQNFSGDSREILTLRG